MFIGRQQELDTLNKLYHSGKFEFAVIYGRRRVGKTALISEKRIAPELSAYMGGVFEEICRQCLWRLLLDGKCAVDFCDLGRWWGTNPKTRTQEEIDIMGTDRDSALFAECKWTNEKVDLSVLETLVERSNLFHYKQKHFYLFAKTDFTKGCMDKAAELGNVTLVAYSDMLK